MKFNHYSFPKRENSFTKDQFYWKRITTISYRQNLLITNILHINDQFLTTETKIIFFPGRTRKSRQIHQPARQHPKSKKHPDSAKSINPILEYPRTSPTTQDQGPSQQSRPQHHVQEHFRLKTQPLAFQRRRRLHVLLSYSLRRKKVLAVAPKTERRRPRPRGKQ